MNTKEMLKDVLVFEDMWSLDGESRYNLVSFDEAHKQVEHVLNPKSLLLSLKTVFSGLDLYHGAEELPEADDWELVHSGYTYNGDSNYTERDFVNVVYASDELDISIAFTQFHYGGDARVGFTDFFAFKMEGTYDMEIYEALSNGGDGFEVQEPITVDGVDYWVSIRDAFDCYCSISTDNGHGGSMWLDEEYVDLYNMKDAEESIRELLSKNPEWHD